MTISLVDRQGTQARQNRLPKLAPLTKILALAPGENTPRHTHHRLLNPARHLGHTARVKADLRTGWLQVHCTRPGHQQVRPEQAGPVLRGEQALSGDGCVAGRSEIIFKLDASKIFVDGRIREVCKGPMHLR